MSSGVLQNTCLEEHSCCEISFFFMFFSFFFFFTFPFLYFCPTIFLSHIFKNKQFCAFTLLAYQCIRNGVQKVCIKCAINKSQNNLITNVVQEVCVNVKLERLQKNHRCLEMQKFSAGLCNFIHS